MVAAHRRIHSWLERADSDSNDADPPSRGIVPHDMTEAHRVRVPEYVQLWVAQLVGGPVFDGPGALPRIRRTPESMKFRNK